MPERPKSKQSNKEWPDRPYKGLAHYERNDAKLLAGRDQDMEQCALKLQDNRTTLLILHGETACGKSSFIRAGLLPYFEDYLEQFFVVPEVIITSSGHCPLQKIGKTLLSMSTQLYYPHEAKTGQDYLSLQDQIRHHLATAETGGELDAISAYRALQGLANRPEILILIIDQAEEVFLPRSFDEEKAKAYFDFLHLLCIRPLPVRVCISMRSEYKAQFDDELLSRGVKADRLVGYYLAPLDKKKIIEAIVHPTKGVLGEHYGFTYADGVAEEIARKVDELRETRRSKRVLLGGVLPTVQVMCDRLWNRIISSKSKIITMEDFLALGDPSDQILWHIEESLREAFSESQVNTTNSPLSNDSEPDVPEAAYHRNIRHHIPRFHNQGPTSDPMITAERCSSIYDLSSVEIDRWLIALCMFAETLSDGRVISKTLSRKKFLNEVEGLSLGQAVIASEEISRDKNDKVLDHLLKKTEYILKRTSSETGEMLALVHDAIGLVLARWKNEYEVIKPGQEVESTDSILSSAALTERDLYGTGPICSLTLRTIDDRIWDHLIAIYAWYKGFFQRLGFKIHIQQTFSGPRPPNAAEYRDFLKSGGGSPRDPRLVVLPLAVFPDLRTAEWDMIGISSVYRGYALIGKSRGEIPEIKGVSTEEGRQALKELVAILRKGEFRVGLFEEESARFYQMLGTIVSEKPLDAPDLVKSKADGKDILYQMLISDDENSADFVVGSAPTRALCEQAGFRVYVDLQDLQNIIAQTENSRDTIRDLSMHEVWLVDKGLSNPILQRLASVLHYTVDYVLRDPEDFARFIYDWTRKRNSEGDTPIARRFIRNAVAACYKFVPLNLYAPTYLLPHSRDYFRIKRDAPPVFDASTRYKSLMHSQQGCEDRLDRLAKALSFREDSTISKLIERACWHRQLYNYGDAGKFFREAYQFITKLNK